MKFNKNTKNERISTSSSTNRYIEGGEHYFVVSMIQTCKSISAQLMTTRDFLSIISTATLLQVFFFRVILYNSYLVSPCVGRRRVTFIKPLDYIALRAKG